MTAAVPLHMITESALAEELRSRGWRCEPDTGQSWEKPSEMSRRLWFGPNFLANLLSRGQMPPGLQIHRAKVGGHIVLVRGNAESEQWLKARRQK